jgi:WXG100 family type VII secretion target
MNGTLTVEPAKLKATASSFQQTSSAIKNLTNQMTQTVNALTGTVWEGEAAQQYKSKFAGLQDEMQRIDRMIQEHVSDLQEMASSYEQAENTAAQTASSLKQDIF